MNGFPVDILRPVSGVLRIAALLSASALGLHELRWLLAPAAREPSHGYVPFAGALAGLLIVLAAAQLIGRIAARRGEGETLPFRRAWPLAVVVLLAVFSLQELAEGALLTQGALLTVPLAMSLGALVALALAGAGALVAAAARSHARATPRPPALPRPRRRDAARRRALALHLAGRAPPRLC